MNNNFVTAETAARLKAAGFPQPEPQAGQVWYSEIGNPFIIANAEGEIVCGVFLNRNMHGFVDNFGNRATFAPGVADLLRELGLEYDISTIGDQYIVIRRNEKDEILKDWVNDNPAEALAAAWLELREKK